MDTPFQSGAQVVAASLTLFCISMHCTDVCVVLCSTSVHLVSVSAALTLGSSICWHRRRRCLRNVGAKGGSFPSKGRTLFSLGARSFVSMSWSHIGSPAYSLLPRGYPSASVTLMLRTALLQPCVLGLI